MHVLHVAALLTAAPGPTCPAMHRDQVSVDHNAALHGIDLEDIQLHRLSLLERRRVMRGMIG